MRSMTFLAVLSLTLGLAPLAQAQDSYVRFENGGSPQDAALQTAVAHFSHPDKNVEIVLYGVVHIAELDYYAKVQKDLDSYDVVLYEGVAPGTAKLTEQDKSLGKMQKMMGEMLGLTFQKDGIDYTRSNLVHADMNMDQLKKAMGGKSINPLGGLMGEGQMKQMGPMLKMFGGFAKSFMKGNPMMQDRMKMMMGRQMTNADLSKVMPKKMANAILIERNTLVMERLAQQLETTKSGTIAIFYGAAHHVDFEKRLSAMGYTRTSKRWRSAWTMGQGVGADAAPLPRTPKVPTVSTGKIRTPGVPATPRVPTVEKKQPETAGEPRWF